MKVIPGPPLHGARNDAPVSAPLNASFPKLHAHVAGGGPPLVLLHGGHGSWTHWTRNIDVLAQHFRVIAFDLPGYGASPDVPKDIPTDDYVSWVADAVAAVAAADSIELIGFSFGGALSARIAPRLGNAIRRVSLLGPSGFGARAVTELDKLPPPGDDRRIAIAAANLGSFMLAKPAAPDDPVVAIQLANIDGTRFDSRRVSRRSTMLDDLPRIPAPVQMIWGAHDKLPIPSLEARAEECRRARPDVRIAIVPDGGHWIQYDQPDAINRLLIDFHRRD
jgi:2-hydroxy-6-oxonona-2,4-dienedioate hydrolase